MFRFLLSLVALVAFFLWASPAAAQSFTVTVTHGQTELGKDQNSYQPAVVNSTYAIPAWGKTADNSSLTITFNADNRFRLLPNSEAQVTTGGEGDSNSAWHRVVSLKIGQASIDHNAGAAPTVHLDCETPTAVCGAVGTEYDVDATHGIYNVKSGNISVHSDTENDNLKMAIIHEGGTVTYAPGRENTYSNGDFSGTVLIGGHTFRAASAGFSVAKLQGSDSEIAVRITSGSLGGNPPGSYVLEGGKLVTVTGKAATIHPQYLEAAQKEGALNVQRAADRASNRPFGQDAELKSATAEATKLRHELFNRNTDREINKQVTQEIIENTTRNAAAAASRNAAEEASRNAASGAMRGGH